MDVFNLETKQAVGATRKTHSFPSLEDDEVERMLQTLIERNEDMAYGSHASATYCYDFLRTEMADMARLGYWTVLPYRLVWRLPCMAAPLGRACLMHRLPGAA
jgi:hypothetical protein